MPQFKVLQYNQMIMAYMGIHSHRLSEPTNEFFYAFGTYYVLFCAIVLDILSTGMYILTNLSQFHKILQTFVVFIGGFQHAGMLLSIGLHMKKVKLLQLDLQEIVDQDKTPEIREMYWANEQKCRKLTIIFCQSLISIIILFSAFLAYAIYCICCGNLETSTWLLPFNMIVPFDTETIVGWFFLWFLQLNMSIAYMACIVATTTYFCCCCLYLCAICEHFAIHFQIINRDIDQFHANELGAFEKFNKKLAEKVRTAIGLHVKMLKIFQMIEEINSGGILSLLPINAMYMSLSMYVLESSEFELVWTTNGMISLCCSLMWPFLICHFATHAIDRVSLVGNTVYDSNWDVFTPKMRKYLVLIMLRAKRPIQFTGFSLISCENSTFAKICQTSGSYYLIFRSLAQR